LSRIIIDASVAARWCLPVSREHLVQEAVGLLESFRNGEIEFVVPELFWPELANVLWKATVRQEIDASWADKAFSKIWSFDIPTLSSSQFVPRALPFAISHRHTVYGSVYVALALACDAELITADEQLANSLSARFPVKWLGAF
jgi:predicted nucleic acid-binding protein